MIFATIIKLIVVAGLLIILRILFPALVRGFRRIMLVIIVAMILFALVVTYS